MKQILFSTCFFLIILTMVGCVHDKNQAPLQRFQPPKVRVEDPRRFLFSAASTFEQHDFPLLYIGPWKQALHIIERPDLEPRFEFDQNKPARTGEFAVFEATSPQHPYSLPELSDDTLRCSRETPVFLFVDSDKTACNYKPLSGETCRCIPVFLQNTSDDTLIAGANNMLDLALEQWNGKQWANVFGPLFFGCGNGVYSFFLPPGEIAVTMLCLEKSNACLRVSIGNSHSNSFLCR